MGIMSYDISLHFLSMLHISFTNIKTLLKCSMADVYKYKKYAWYSMAVHIRKLQSADGVKRATSRSQIKTIK